MRKIIFTLLLFCTLFTTICIAQIATSPKHEYRAVWLTTIEGLDWPKSKANSPQGIEAQKHEFITILDSLASLNINTIIFQTRIRGNLIYPSAIEPFSGILTGVEGKDPGYDPLAFAIEECHKRGMQIHAWLVALPLGSQQHLRNMGKNGLAKKNPKLCKLYKGSWYMEPALPETAEYLKGIVTELVKNYDIDGIHFDYIRYPDRPKEYPDKDLHKKYGKGYSLEQWRRANITNIVRILYDAVKSKKPWVRVSCAPLGKHYNLLKYPSKGWNAYGTVFQEAQEWLNQGIMDILFPMLYFPDNDFYPFVLDWQENSNGRHIAPGLGIYRLLATEGNWPIEEIKRQLQTSRNVGAAGAAMFRTKHLLENTKGLANEIKELYRYPAMVPPITWYNKEIPNSPQALKAGKTEGKIELNWEKAANNSKEPGIKYNVYCSDNYPVDITKPENIAAIEIPGSSFLCENHNSGKCHWAITAVDAWGQESAPAEIALTKKNDSDKNKIISFVERKEIGVRLVIKDGSGKLIFSTPYTQRINLKRVPKGFYTIETTIPGGAVIDRRKIVL